VRILGLSCDSFGSFCDTSVQPAEPATILLVLKTAWVIPTVDLMFSVGWQVRAAARVVFPPRPSPRRPILALRKRDCFISRACFNSCRTRRRGQECRRSKKRERRGEVKKL